METEPLVFVGIDWASTEHQVRSTGADRPTQRVFPDGARARTDRSDSKCLFPARRGVIHHACWRGGQHA
jgi:hypothetical protein